MFSNLLPVSWLNKQINLSFPTPLITLSISLVSVQSWHTGGYHCFAERYIPVFRFLHRWILSSLGLTPCFSTFLYRFLVDYNHEEKMNAIWYGQWSLVPLGWLGRSKRWIFRVFHIFRLPSAFLCRFLVDHHQTWHENI